MKNILQCLFENRNLSKPDAKTALIKIATGSCNDAQASSFITVYLMRKITLDELAGFREALIDLGNKIDLTDHSVMDLCGTGGDNKDTFNISTLSSFVVAATGIPIAKHGNYSVSSSCGSSNILEYFGYDFPNTENRIKRELEKTGISFLHAPVFQPALKKVSQIRKDLQVKTFFNMLGPLIHPASPKKQLLGVYSSELADLYSEILKQTINDYVIVHSLDGFDEISLTGPYRILNRNNDITSEPAQQGFKNVTAESIKGGKTIRESAKIFIDILQGNGTPEQNEVVIANSSAAIKCYHPQFSQAESINMATESLQSLKAFQTFKKLIN